MNSLYQAFFRKLPVRAVETDVHLHLLNASEIARLRSVHRRALLASAGFSVLGFLAYYLPVYSLPGAFPKTTLALPFAGRTALPLAETAWGLVLMFAEIYALVLLNLWAVHETAVATGYLNAENKSSRGASVLDVGLEKKNTLVAKYGIDPFQGLNRWALFTFNLALRLKGFLGNKLLQYLVRRLMGRLAVRAVLDFAGMPLYMAINALSTHTVLREARVIIMGRQLLEMLAPRLGPDAVTTDEERALVYDTLQYIAVSKRDYHENHYVLTRVVFERYGLTPEAAHAVPDDYLEKLCASAPRVRSLCTLLIVLGFLLDGRVSVRERLRISELNERGVLSEDYAALQGYAAAFTSGAGIEPLLARYLDAPHAREQAA